MNTDVSHTYTAFDKPHHLYTACERPTPLGRATKHLERVTFPAARVERLRGTLEEDATRSYPRLRYRSTWGNRVCQRRRARLRQPARSLFASSPSRCPRRDEDSTLTGASQSSAWLPCEPDFLPYSSASLRDKSLPLEKFVL